jgi:nucleotide-binding universal stress UspA family protein
MPIRTILVPLPDATGAAATLGTAFGLAKTFNAHAEVLHLRADPANSVSDFVGESVSPALVEEVMEVAAKRADAVAGRAKKAFEAAIAKAKIKAATRSAAKPESSVSYREETGLSDYWVETLGRINDLTVVRRPRDSSDVVAASVAESALMGTGRPVLLAPPSMPRSLGASVAIAWNGSIEASRAVASAMPFIMRAKTVTAISIVEDGGRDHNVDGLVDYLRWHGVRAKANPVKNRGGDVGKALTAAASRAKADLLVMGAYTHSRMREMILGGVTDHVLHGAKIPVLLAH